MGVRGLTSYIAKYSDRYLEPYELKDCTIVVDGNSLASQLYIWVSNCNCAFGGDYDKYANCVKNFFSLLKKCDVTPLVMFDGGYETKKLSTVHARLKNKLSTAKIVTPETQSKLKFFPLFMKEVFRDVLIDMEISFAQCDFEADAEIAAVARRLGCPVLSYDSDFYVYDVKYIPFSTVVLEPEQDDSVEEECVGYHINCQIYNIEKFLDNFGGLDKSLLPVMAALLGNDYIEHKVFENFLSQIKLPKTHSVSKPQQQIMVLLEWLRKETVETAVEKIVNHLKKSQRQVIAKQLKAIIDWFKHKLRCGSLPPCFINMLVHRIHFSAPQVEDFSLPFSHRISLPVLSVIFGLLTAGNVKQELQLCYIVHMQNAQPQKVILLPTYSTTSVKEFPPLENVPDLPMSVRRCLLYDAMEFDANDILALNGFPDDWKIFIVALTYWGRNVSDPSLKIHHIHAILFSIISLNIVDRHTGYYRSKKTFLKQTGSKLKKMVQLQNVKGNEDKTCIEMSQSANRESSEMCESNLPCHKDISYDTVTEALAAVSSEDCFCLVETMLPYHQMDECLKRRPRLFSVSVVHIFAQFQSCLLHAMHLNALLNFPFVQCRVENFYSGTLIYNAYLNFRKQSNIETYILTQPLKCVPSIAAFYNILVKSVTDFLPNLTVTHKKKRDKRKKQNDSKESVSEESQTDEIAGFMICNRFSALSLGGNNN